MQEVSLTDGPIFQKLIRFSLPMLAGNLLQQVYNLVDTWIVGKFLGADALAAVGSSYTLMVFVTSIIIGLCMGSGAMFSVDYGAGDDSRLGEDIHLSFGFILAVCAAIYLIFYPGMGLILRILQIPQELLGLTRAYIGVVFAGMIFVFFFNFYAYLLRAMGNSVVPLVFLAISSVMNIVLDIWFVVGLRLGVAGAAIATVMAQEFGNAYSLFVSQNYGAKKDERIRRGSRISFAASTVFCVIISALIFIFADRLMGIFVDATEYMVIAEGARYLRIEGTMYVGIGLLFLWYGYFRGINRPQISLVLTVVSLGTRVVLSYIFAPHTPLGVVAIWLAIPIGWGLADIAGWIFYRRDRKWR